MAALKRIKSGDNIEHILEILEKDGCVVIENVLDQTAVETLKAELTPHLNQTPNCHGDFYGYVTKRLSSLLVKSKICQDMCIHPAALRINDHFLLPHCRQYQLNLTQGIQIGPGEPQQIIHRDDSMFPCSHPGQEWMINFMWAVDDFTLENGATHVVPGSHKWDPLRQPEDDEILQAEMTAGSVLVYFASLLHGGGKNWSEHSRTGIVLSYNLGWLRQAENHYLAIPRDIAKQFPERLQKLIGYFIHEPNLGCVEGQDPILLLQGEHIENSGFEEFLSEESKEFLRQYKRGVRKAA